MTFHVHHIALTAEDLPKTEPFYDAVLAIFGYKRHNTSARVTSWTPPPESAGLPEFLIYAARDEQQERRHQLYDPGVHHYCFGVDSKEQVDRVFELAPSVGGRILDAPNDYPRYAANVGSSRYYAVFVNDPSGIKLEFAWMPKATSP